MEDIDCVRDQSGLTDSSKPFGRRRQRGGEGGGGEIREHHSLTMSRGAIRYMALEHLELSWRYRPYGGGSQLTVLYPLGRGCHEAREQGRGTTKGPLRQPSKTRPVLFPGASIRFTTWIGVMTGIGAGGKFSDYNTTRPPLDIPTEQVLGRNLALFGVIVAFPPVRGSLWVLMMFLAWAASEIIR